jgi:hypothetical protein
VLHSMPEESICVITTLRGLTRTLMTLSGSYPSVSQSLEKRWANMHAPSLNGCHNDQRAVGWFRSMAVPQRHGVKPGRPPACPAPRCGRAAHSSRPLMPSASPLSSPYIRGPVGPTEAATMARERHRWLRRRFGARNDAPSRRRPAHRNEPTAIAVARTAAARAECGRSRETLSSHNRMLHDNYNFCSRFLTYGYLITRCPHARDGQLARL